MKLSKEQKEEAAATLNRPYGLVTLRCDGYLVSLYVNRVGKKSMTYRVLTYVNGKFDGRWVSEKNAAPESRFLRKSVRSNLTPAQRTKAEKALGKRYVAKDPHYSGSHTLYLPDWPNGKKAITHLCSVCDSVELLSEDEGKKALDEITTPASVPEADSSSQEG